MDENSDFDYELESFYIGFKQSMYNFYDKHTFKRPIELWSTRLNKLKKEKQYKKIQKLIIKIISLYSIDLMRIGDEYNAYILDTNIKRFNKITLKNTILNPIDFKNNIIFLLFSIFISLSKKNNNDIQSNFKDLFVQIELYIIYKDFTSLIEYAVQTKTFSVLDKLFNYSDDIYNNAKSMYNIDSKFKLCARKFYDSINYNK